MKFILNQEGVLLHVQENKAVTTLKKHHKPIIKSMLYGVFLFIGYQLLQQMLTGGLTGIDLLIHEGLEWLGWGHYVAHPFSNLTPAISF